MLLSKTAETLEALRPEVLETFSLQLFRVTVGATSDVFTG